ncbi:MAG: hypothetical protein ABI670_11010 [Chloroflexota bacterium]
MDTPFPIDKVKGITLSYRPANEGARKAYASVGFRETGEIEEGEVVAALDVENYHA